VLTSGARDAPARQQTLRNTIEWSYKLLNAEEQQLFRRLSVFVGGSTLQAIEEISVALDDGKRAGRVLDGVASLIDKSLLRQTEETGEEPRLVMLETIREYALESLAASGEAEAVRRAHATYYLQFAKRAAKEIPGANQGIWLRRLEQEHDNLRAAFSWLQEQQEQELFLQLAIALEDFWSHTIYLSEGRRFLEQGLMSSNAVQASTRAKALYIAGSFAVDLGDRGRGVALSQESLRLFRELGDKQGIAASLRVVVHDVLMRGDMKTAAALYAEVLGIARESGDRREICFALMTVGSNAYFMGDYDKARTALEECLSHNKELRDAGGIGYALFFLACVSYAQGDDAKARALAEEGLAIFKEGSAQGGQAEILIFLAHVISCQGDHATARALAEEGLALSRKLEGKRGIVEGLRCLGLVALRQGSSTEAYACYEEGVRVLAGSDRQDGWNKLLMATCLAGLGSVVAAQGHSVWAVRLWSVARTLPPDPAWLAQPIERAHYEQSMATVRAQLDEETFAAAWAEGQSMTPEQALAAQNSEVVPGHLSPAPPAAPARKSGAPYPADLTRREREVLRLVAQGLTDAEVAERLMISPHTVHVHISAIYSKLGVKTRSAATRYAFEHNLV
jgi:DNA-binding CsgD family transcriptional regulator/tetratricopeptide (TPR) repeat protein